MSSRIARGLALSLGLGALVAAPAQAQDWHGPSPLMRGNLLVSESTYAPAEITPGVTRLPPGCTGSACVPAVADAPTRSSSTTAAPTRSSVSPLPGSSTSLRRGVSTSRRSGSPMTSS